MITNAYSIYDRKALVYGVPFFAATDGLALRMFADAVNDPSTTLFKHSTDFVLYRVGAYDDANGGLLPVSVLEHIADAAALVRRDIHPDLDAAKSNTVPPALPVNS